MNFCSLALLYLSADCGLGIKSYLRPAEIPSFSCRDLSRRNKDDFFCLVVSPRYLYILFL